MLSILVPINSHTKFFRKAIESIEVAVNEFSRPTELLIILNNLSVEGTKSVMEDLKTYPFKKVILTSNAKTLSEVLNYGIESAAFELIARMDADDVVLPQRFARQVDFILSHPHQGAVGGQVIFIDESGREIGQSHYPIASIRINRLLKYQNCLAHPAVLYRKSAVLSVGAYNTRFKYAEDYDLWVRLSAVWEISNLNTLVLKYRIHSAQTSSFHLWIQLKSTIEIMGLLYDLNAHKLNSDLQNIPKGSLSQSIGSAIKTSSISKNKKFKGAVSLMILRRGHKFTGIPLTQSCALLFIAFRSNPILSLATVMNFLKTRIIRF